MLCFVSRFSHYSRRSQDDLMCSYTVFMSEDIRGQFYPSDDQGGYCSACTSSETLNVIELVWKKAEHADDEADTSID